MTITFVGHGYVGLVTATIFADLGNTVHVIGHTQEKIDNLKKGIIPIYEPGLEEMVKRNVDGGRLLFSLDYEPAIPESEIVFIAVGTPPKENGEADLSTVFKVAEQIGKHLKNYTVIATKSTVPVSTNQKIKDIVSKNKPEGIEFDVASVPEFLREGSAISDTLYPDRIIIGSENDRARDLLIELHKTISAKVITTNLETAEMIKYASNSFLATKISFANSIAHLSELTGADAVKVLSAVGMDKRIGQMFLQPGPGYGGSCFPKDVEALINIASGYDYDFELLRVVQDINKYARLRIVEKAEVMLGDVRGKQIGILGLAFKPNTDDMRFAPSVDIIKMLQEKGATIKAFDPVSMNTAKPLVNDVNFCSDSYEVSDGSDLLIVVTDWNEFKELNFKKIKEKMNSAKIIDTRNIYDPNEIRSMGFEYMGVGR